MGASKEALKRALKAFQAAASRRSGVAPKRLLEAVRLLALEDAEDIPNYVALEDVVRRASRLAAHRDPDRPLDQAKNGKLLWELFQQLTAASVGRVWKGRRGHPTRFTFDQRLSCSDLGEVFDLLGITQPSLERAEPHRPKDVAPIPSAPVRSDGNALDRDTVVTLLKGHEDEIHRLGVSELSLFGSVARNEARSDSDVDLLATFRDPITSDSFFTAKFFLEDLLGRRVDLLTEAALRDRVRHAIESELVRVA